MCHPTHKNRHAYHSSFSFPHSRSHRCTMQANTSTFSASCRSWLSWGCRQLCWRSLNINKHPHKTQSSCGKSYESNQQHIFQALSIQKDQKLNSFVQVSLTFSVSCQANSQSCCQTVLDRCQLCWRSRKINNTHARRRDTKVSSSCEPPSSQNEQKKMTFFAKYVNILRLCAFSKPVVLKALAITIEIYLKIKYDTHGYRTATKSQQLRSTHLFAD